MPIAMIFIDTVDVKDNLTLVDIMLRPNVDSIKDNIWWGETEHMSHAILRRCKYSAYIPSQTTPKDVHFLV